MKSARILKEKINSGQLTLGIIAINNLWIELIEIARDAGLDYLIIDEEHGHFNPQLVIDACSFGRTIDFPVLIRPHQPEFNLLRRTADKGACGFLLPTVENTAQLDQVRDALYMPPRGKRRPGGMGNRWVNDVNYETWRDTVENDFIVLPQIENKIGLGNVDEIAAHEITTALAIGPYDLSADLGVCWEPDNPKLLDAIKKIVKAGDKVGKKTWGLGDTSIFLKMGLTFLAVGEPSWFLQNALKNHVDDLRSGKPDNSNEGKDYPV